MTEDERHALRTYVKLIRAAESVTNRAHRHLAATGLTPSQFGVIEALLHLGPCCQKELAEKILKTSGNITLVIDNLEKRGLVRRRRDEDDRRYITVSLTEEGERLIRAIFPVHAREIAQEMSCLSADEQELLGTLCRRLGKQEKR
jgi:MarR family 2-MHQ and catechol resistance regulon transcriptional repressor